MTAKREQSGGRILLGDNTVCGMIMMWPIMFPYSGFRISTGLPYTYV